MKRWLENEEKYVAYLETNILVNLVQFHYMSKPHNVKAGNKVG